MTLIDMLANWPGWDQKTPDEILASPAWAMKVRWNDEEMILRCSKEAPRDVIGIRIAFDGEEHFLGLGNRSTFPDLNILWTEKKNLPDALILALIEKECGALLQLLENAVRCQLTVLGLASPEERAGTQGFEVVNARGEIIAFFSMSISRLITLNFGDVAHIDTSHSEIRALEMRAFIQYATFSLNDAEAATITSGDCLLLPEANDPSTAKWLMMGVPANESFYVIADEQASITFGQMADGQLPAIPPPNRLALVRNGKTIAVGCFCYLGQHPAFAIEEVL